MGNHKFRLSDMMPNAWFYKLRDMSKSRKHKASQSHPSKKKLIPSPTSISTAASHRPHLSHQHHRRSLYFHNATEPTIRSHKFHNSFSPRNPKASDTHFPDPPRNSSIRRRRKTKSKRQSIYKPSPKALSSDQTQDCYFFSLTDQSSSDTDFHASSCSCRVTSSTTDIILDVNGKSSFSMAELNLPPILTKPAKPQDTIVKENQGSVSIKIVDENYTHKTRVRTRKPAAYSAGVKLRANSPKIACKKKVQGGGRRSVSSPAGKRRSGCCWESFAMVKSSVDPQRDFKDSMKEMIVENNIRASKDLEELLACYLSLNSDQYHDFIVKAFEQIWFDLANLRL
ncbi:transcription repressor OFP1-like [Diospyros lotus]|uniref:transcription repressor OFP1-like n=1 Tax=Diospyros lotus TaxID=55363 RepID=UPI00224F9A58|nr:transcription repressor OFP1-like [Diospyros lotus]